MKKNWKEKMDAFVFATEKIGPLLDVYAQLLFLLLIVFLVALRGKIFPNNAAAELVFVFMSAFLMCDLALNVILALDGGKSNATRRLLVGLHIAIIAFGIPAVWFFGISLGFGIWQNIVILAGGVVIGVGWRWMRKQKRKEKDHD